jgi:hypothetical protein
MTRCVRVGSKPEPLFGGSIPLKAVPEKLKKKSNKIKNGSGLKEY